MGNQTGFLPQIRGNEAGKAVYMQNNETQKLLNDKHIFNGFLDYYCKNCRHSGISKLCDKPQFIRPDDWGGLACTRYRCKALEWVWS